MNLEVNEVNEVNAEVQHCFFGGNKVNKFETQIDNAEISLWSIGRSLHIEIHGKKAVKKLEELMLELFSLLFLYLGGYAKIIKIDVNSQLLDLSDFIGKYDTWEYFIKSNLVICPISEDTINESVLHGYRNLKQMPLYSMQYLVSNNYKPMIINHKITLLLHVIDGVVPDIVVDTMKAEIASKFQIQDGVGTYKPKVYYLSKYHFFNYDEKYKCEVLSILKITQYKFLQILTDTRNWYSHFLEENKRVNRLRDGAEMLIYFEIILYSLRLYLIKKIGINANEEWIKEYFYAVYDWISEIKYERQMPLKSETYKIIKSFEEMRRIMEELAESMREELSTQQME